MFSYLSVLIISAVSTLGNILLKKFQQDTSENLLNFCLYNLINALTASIFFYTVSGFKIDMNISTFVYSAVTSVVVAGIIILNICIMTRMPLVVVSLLTTAGSIISTSLFGLFILKEIISLRLVLAIIFVLISVSLPFLKNRKYRPVNNRDTGAAEIILCVLLFAASGANVILSKLYVNDSSVCSSNSYFFMMNFILIIASAVVLFIYALKSGISFMTVCGTFSFKNILNIAVRTLSSNMSAMLTMAVLSEMNVSLYTVLTSSLALVGNALVSKFYFREDMPPENRTAVVLSVAAILLAR